MENWRDHVRELIGEEVEIVVGDERIVAKVRRITVHVGRGTIYELSGVHRGWEIQATTDTLTEQGGSQRLRADGDVQVWLHTLDANKG